MYEKSTRVSINNREKGNKAYAKKEFLNALIFYNKAIAFAPNDSTDLGLAYGNRSAVYFELKKYDDCLKNIRLARKNGYPAEKATILKEREKKAKYLRENHAENTEDDPSSFFKLSYDANQKIPFIIDQLEVRKTDEFGRGIYTTRSSGLKPGDIVAIEKPLISVLYNSNDCRYKHCCSCMKSCMMNLIPCIQTSGVMFCSENCREKISKRMKDPLNMIVDFHSINGPRIIAIGMDVYGSVEKFKDFVEKSEMENKNTVFDYDLTNPKSKDYKKNILNCILSLKTSSNLKTNGNKSAFNAMAEGSKGLLNFMDRMGKVISNNAIGLQFLDAPTITFTAPTLVSRGSSVLAFGSLFNHSCDPNVMPYAVDDKIVFIVCKPIKPNEQLFINYIGDFYNKPSISGRRASLLRYGFTCECDACTYDYKAKTMIQPYPDYFPPFLRGPPKSIKDCVNEVRNNYKFIEDHAYNILTLPNYDRIQRNIDLISFIAYHATFPY